MKKLIISLFFVSALFSNIGAAPLAPQEALQRLNKSGFHKLSGRNEPKLTMTFNTPADEAALYIFSNNEEYLVVSADEKAPPLLGYGVNFAENNSDLPPQLKWWLSEYVKQIECLRNNFSVENDGGKAPVSENMMPIGPLLRTEWDQMNPYNYMCPTMGFTRCPTGCVATSTAQVMKYHNYPEKGTGNISYAWPSGGRNLTMDFSEISFDWDNMLDQYIDGEYSDEEADAVALLMKACGYASKMDYSAYISSALATAQTYGLVEYFGYDKGIDYLLRETFTYDEWSRMLYDNLKNYGPVIYGGMSDVGEGHSFVCDGFDGEGYFHFNWGWSGMGDGFYRLDALDPTYQGTGGSISGYNFIQDAVINICPPRSGSQYAPQFVTQIGNLEAEVENSLLYLGLSDISIWGTLGWANMTYRDMSFSLGIRLENMTGNEADPIYIISDNYTDITLSPYGVVEYTNGTNNRLPVRFELNKIGLPDGLYNAEIIAKDLSETGNGYLKVKGDVGYATSFLLDKQDGHFTVTNYPKAELSISDFNLKTPLFMGLPSAASVTISNKSEFQLTRSLAIIGKDKNNNQIYSSGSVVVTVDPQETIDFNFNFVFSGNFPPVAQQVYLSIYDMITDQFYDIEPLQVTLEPNPGLPVINQTLSIENADYIDGVYIIRDDTNLKIKYDLEVEQGYFFYPLVFSILEEGNPEPVSTLTPNEDLFIPIGETYSGIFVYPFPEAEAEINYTLTSAYMVADNYERLESIRFVVDNSEVYELSEGDLFNIEYFDLQGRKVINPSDGIFIEKRILRRGEVITRKLRKTK